MSAWDKAAVDAMAQALVDRLGYRMSGDDDGYCSILNNARAAIDALAALLAERDAAMWRAGAEAAAKLLELETIARCGDTGLETMARSIRALAPAAEARDA